MPLSLRTRPQPVAYTADKVNLNRRGGVLVSGPRIRVSASARAVTLHTRVVAAHRLATIAGAVTGPASESSSRAGRLGPGLIRAQGIRRTLPVGSTSLRVRLGVSP